jgi:peptidoglycan hydrolase-like protein with peptidoglycan-binding domain
MTVAFKNVGKFGPSETTHQQDTQNLATLAEVGTTRKYLITGVNWVEGNEQPVQIKARTLVETDDTVANSSVGLGVVPYGSRYLCTGQSGTDVKRLQLSIGMTEKEQDGVFGPITEAAVKIWQQTNKLGVRTVTLISDLDPADRHFFGTRSEIVTYVGNGCIDADDWAVLLAMPGSTFPVMVAATEAEDPADIKFFNRARILAEENAKKNLTAATVAEDDADRKFFDSSYQPDPYDIAGRESIDETEGIESTIDPADIKFTSGLYSKPKVYPPNHPMHGKYT